VRPRHDTVVRASQTGRSIFMSESVQLDLFGSAHGHQIRVYPFGSRGQPNSVPDLKKNLPTEAPPRALHVTWSTASEDDRRGYPSAAGREGPQILLEFSYFYFIFEFPF
jgi:hypothetical protein